VPPRPAWNTAAAGGRRSLSPDFSHRCPAIPIGDRRYRERYIGQGGSGRSSRARNAADDSPDGCASRTFRLNRSRRTFVQAGHTRAVLRAWTVLAGEWLRHGGQGRGSLTHVAICGKADFGAGFHGYLSEDASDLPRVACAVLPLSAAGGRARPMVVPTACCCHVEDRLVHAEEASMPPQACRSALA
jgi:hypothetical protein